MERKFYKCYNSHISNDVRPVTVEEVRGITANLKLDKAVGLDDIPNEFFKYSKNDVVIFVSLMCNSFLIHEFLPEPITDAKIIPLLKGKLLDVSSSDNYRPITISTSISKIFERILYLRIKDSIKCEDNQFGYKDQSATDMCIFTLKQTVKYYHSRNTPVYACFVDVKAAFDRVSFWKMFTKLLDRGISKKIVNIIRFWYVNQALCVSWGNILSRKFNMSNGIKQGALLSPYFYNIYAESLNMKLNEAGLGCCIANHSLNNLSWADDLVVLAPSSHALIGLLKVCEKFAEEHLVLFNTKKTQCMLFPCKATPIVQLPRITLCGKVLKFVDQFTYLGHVISSDLTDDADIVNQNRKLCARANTVIRKFKSSEVNVKSFLFKTYCYNIYGMALWSKYKAATINRLRVNYNNTLRRMTNRPPWSSASAMFVEHGLRGFYELRRCCCYSLRSRLQQSSNTLVQQVMHSDAYWASSLQQHWDAVLFPE